MRWTALFSGLGLLACGSAFSDSDGETGGDGGAGAIVGSGGFPSGGGSGGASGGASGATGGATGGNAGASTGGTCSTLQFPSSADTAIYPQDDCSSWDWSINSGSAIILPVGGVTGDASRVLLRFELGADAHQKLQSPGASVKLVLTRVLSGSDCLDSCPFNPGKIQAYPLRLEWAEGDGGNNTGANWCFAGAGKTEPWSAGGAAGPQDSGVLVGSGDVLPSATSVSIPLEIAPFKDWADAVSGRLSVLLTPTAGVKYFFASREHPDVLKPMLEVTLCTSD